MDGEPWDGTISDEQMLRLKAARHRHAEEVLESVIRNEPLMAQLQESLAAIERGETGTSREEIEAELRARRAG
jgi:predicted transcriptional regulator